MSTQIKEGLAISDKLQIPYEKLQLFEHEIETETLSYTLIIEEIAKDMATFKDSSDINPYIMRVVEATADKFALDNPDSFVNRAKKEFLNVQLKEEDNAVFSNFLLEKIFGKVESEIERFVAIRFFETHRESNPLTAKTIVAPQGAGKSTMINSINNATSEAKKGQNQSTYLKKLISVIDNLSVITTGTGGIFNPSGNKEYEIYKQLGGFCGPIVGKGVLLSDSLTHSLMLLELTRRALDGKTNIMIDTYPRTKGQYMKFSNFVHKLRGFDNRNHAMYYVMLDLLDESQIQQYTYNLPIVEEAALELGKELGTLMKDMTVRSLEINPSSEIETQKKEASILFHELMRKLDTLLPEDYSVDGAKKYFKEVQIRGLNRVLDRMLGRVLKVKNVSDIRGDERKAKSVVARLKDFMSLTLPIAVSFEGIQILSANNSPENVVRNLLKDICVKHQINPEDKSVEEFIQLAGRKAKEEVTGVKKK